MHIVKHIILASSFQYWLTRYFSNFLRDKNHVQITWKRKIIHEWGKYPNMKCGGKSYKHRTPILKKSLKSIKKWLSYWVTTKKSYDIHVEEEETVEKQSGLPLKTEDLIIGKKKRKKNNKLETKDFNSWTSCSWNN